jgi:GT2 family glycosyltransferase/SAM-dependent methyltransferase/glycosyltransferase involved in cell wall biosynthesis
MATRRGGAPRLIDWTGERCVPWAPDVPVVYEHFHRYLWARRLAEGKRVLDVGSGEGFGAALLEDAAASVLGIEIDPVTVEHSRLNYAGPTLEFRQGSATELDRLPADSFDLVVAFEIIEHVDDHDAVLRGIEHVLAPGGIVVMSTPDRAAYTEASGQVNPFHVHELTLEEFHARLAEPFPHVELFALRTISGSRIEALERPAAGPYAGFSLARSGDEWHPAGPPSPLYVLAVAGREALPELARDSTLSDFGLELLRTAERRGVEQVAQVEEQRAHMEAERAKAQQALDAAHAEHAATRLADVHEHERLRQALDATSSELAQAAIQVNQTRLELDRERATVATELQELARVRGSVTWQLFQRTRGKLYGSIGERSPLGRVFSATLRGLGRVALGRGKPTAPAQPGVRAWMPLALPKFPVPVASIVIPVHSGAELTERCLHAIVDATPDLPYEVIVVDDGADADTKALLAAVDGLRVVVNETNLNYLRSVNRGAAEARGRHVVLLNNDTEPQAGWLRALVERADSAPDIGVVAAKLIYPDSLLQEAGGIIWRDGSGWNYGRGDNAAGPEYNYVRDVDYGSAAALLVRRECWRDVGGFDERYAPAYYEDADLCFAARAGGWRVVYEPQATVIHVEGGSQGIDTSSGGKRYQLINQEKFAEKWRAVLGEQLDNPGYERARLASDRRRGPHALIIDHMVPMHDRDAGSLRMYHLIRNLLELGWRVTLIPDNFAPTEPYTSELQGLGVEVLYGAVNVALNIAEHGPRTRLAILSRPYVAPRYLHLVRQHAPAARVAYDTVDLHYLREQRRAELEGNPTTKKAEGFKELELGLARASDVTLVVSEQESEHLRAEVPGLDVEVVPLANEVWPVVPPRSGRSGLLFVGGFAHDPNVDAALYLVRVIMPLVWREFPGVGLTLVGGNPPAEVRALASSGVAVPGWIPDLRPLLESSVANVAPLRYGAGVKGKVTESLGAGLPVVTTPLGAEGLGAVDGEDLLVAADPEAFAAHVVRLLRDEEHWHALSAAGQDLVRRTSSVEAQRAALRRLLEQPVENPELPPATTTV